MLPVTLPSPRVLAGVAAVALTAALTVVVPVGEASAAATVTVTDAGDRALLTECDDGASGTTLREALCEVAAELGGEVVVPAGTTVTLTAGPLTIAPEAASVITVAGSGGRFTVDGAGGRILDVDPELVGGVDVTLARVELVGGHGDETVEAPYAGGGAVIAGTGDAGLPPGALRLEDCTVRDNRNVTGTGDAGAPGGAIQMNGGLLEITDCTFTGNTADGAPGGAVAMIASSASDQLTITGSSFSGNAVTNTGDAAGVLGGGAVFTEAPATITTSTFSGSSVTAATTASGPRGGAVYATGPTTFEASSVESSTVTGGLDEPGAGGALALPAGSTVTASRLVGSTETIGGTARNVAVTGPVAAEGNWWGCADGPAAGCQTLAGGATAASFVGLFAQATPTLPNEGDDVTVTATVRSSEGGAADPRLLALLAGRSVGWSTAPVDAATGGTGGATLLADGTATYTYTTGAALEALVQTTLDGATRTTTVERAVPPSVTTAPADASAAEGATATFTAAVTGNPVPALRWQTAPAGTSTWADVSGATTGTLTVDAERDLQGDRYRVVATNSAGTVTSAPATLTVTWGPEISTAPQDVVVVAGEDATFEVAAAGVPAPTVQWQVRPSDAAPWTDVPAATGTTYVRTTSAADDDLQVRAVLTGSTGAVPSAAATLTVQTPLTVETSPSPVTAVDGQVATFTATVEGSPAPSTVTWERRLSGASTWVAVPGGTSSTDGDLTTANLGVTAARALDGAEYRARATTTLVDGPHEVVTSSAALTVHWVPAFTTQPASTAIEVGQTATFTVAVDARPAATVLWEQLDADGVWQPAGTGTTLSVTPADATSDGTQVRARATNSAGTTVSATAVLSVGEAPAFTTPPQDVTADAGTTATFTVVASGTPAPTLRWQARPLGGAWADVDGATGGTLELTATQALDVRALATNTVEGDVPSGTARLTVLTPPTVSAPADVAVAPGEQATFTVTTGGTPAPTVTWETSADDGTSWEPVLGVAGPELELTATLAGDGLQVRALATSTLVAGSTTVTSAPAVLTVAEVPELVSGPDGVTVGADGVATVAVGRAFELRYTAEGLLTSAEWSASRDGGATWGPLPSGAVTDQIATSPSFGTALAESAGFVTAAAADLTTRTFTLRYTPTSADDGLQLRLRLTSAVGTTELEPVTLNVLAAPTDPDDDGAGGGSGGPGSGGAGNDGAGDGGAGSGPGGSGGPDAVGGAGTPGGGQLGATGAEAITMGLLSVVLLLGGAAVLMVRRRWGARA